MSSDLLPAMDGDSKTMTFLQEVVDILLAYIVESFDRETKVIDFHYPNELLQMNNWELQHDPATLDDILISCRATLKYAIKTGRPTSLIRLEAGSTQLMADFNVGGLHITPCFKPVKYAAIM